MAIKTQGTHLYAVDPADESLITVGCVTSIDGVTTANEQVETTCLESDARTYIAGLATPGNATFGLNFDPSDSTHTRLHALKIAGTSLKWAIGFSDGTAAPVVDSAANLDGPTTRSWINFDGFMTDFPFNFAQNSVIQTTVGIQISGEPVVTAKV